MTTERNAEAEPLFQSVPTLRPGRRASVVPPTTSLLNQKTCTRMAVEPLHTP